MLYSAGHGQHRRGPADRRAEQARRGQSRVAASLGAPLRAASSRSLSRRPSPVLPRRRRTRGPDAAASRRGDGRRGGGCARRARPARRGSCPNRAAPRGDPRRARGRRSTRSTSRARRRSSTGCSPWPPSRRCWLKWSCPTCRSSASGGSEARPRSPRSTLPPACCADGCSAWLAAGASGWARSPCWPACPASSMTSA